MFSLRSLTLLTTGLGFAALSTFAPPSPLKAGKPIVIPGGPGGFDWMLVDSHSHRVFATHKGTKTVAVVDLQTESALPSPSVGTAQGVAIDRKDNKIT